MALSIKSLLLCLFCLPIIASETHPQTAPQCTYETSIKSEHECVRLVKSRVPATCDVTYPCKREGHHGTAFSQCKHEEPCHRDTYHCDVYCCVGWKEDSNGNCTIRNNREPCTLCKNGGHCYQTKAGMQCACVGSFTGPYCESVMCNQKCNNGGICQIKSDTAQCVCPATFTGPQCDQPIPTQQPIAMLNLQPAEAKRIIVTKCPYKGRSYDIGEQFSPEPCQVCHCQSLGSKPVVQCMPKMCPLMRCHNAKKVNGSCCETCYDVHRPRPKYYHAPIMKCPTEILTVNVSSDMNHARLSVKLEARDYRGRKLTVEVTKSDFVWQSSSTNIYINTAISYRDNQGNFAECTFYVHVRDTHSPKFLSCPSDVFVETEQHIITWHDPVATDNVGLKGVPTCTHDKEQRFPHGVSMVTYTATDLAGNLANCHFLVNVGPMDHHGHHHHHYHHGPFDPLKVHTCDYDDNHHHHHHHTWGKDLVDAFTINRHHRRHIIIAAATGSSLFLVLCLICGCCCCRRRSQRAGKMVLQKKKRYNDAILGISAPPPCDNSEKESKGGLDNVTFVKDDESNEKCVVKVKFVPSKKF